MYYIISLYHTNPWEKWITFWRPNNKGYCYSQAMAGKYESPEPGYHDSDYNMPIKIEDADPMFREMQCDGKMRMVIPNNTESRNILGVKQTKNGLQRRKLKTV